VAPNDDHQHVPGPSVWPVGFAIGIVVLLVGLIISWWVTAAGAILAAVFAFLWIRDLATDSDLTHAPDVEPETAGSAVAAAEAEDEHELVIPPEDRFPRSKFLEASTLGLGAVIGGVVTVPALGFMIGPAFAKEGQPDIDVGPITNFPQDKYVVTTFTSNPAQGEVSRRTAYIRFNGTVAVTVDGKQQQQPSFTIISNHCAHLGCPVQPNGPLNRPGTKKFRDVTLIPTVSIAGFGCPCHGGQYDTEGNRTAGPPVRALDRYSFSIRNGHLFLGKPFSVADVQGAGATAQIQKYPYYFPGEHVDGVEGWLYPIPPVTH
jgi:menaquinol-cytochrome c reductase iron-sulfur subunit